MSISFIALQEFSILRLLQVVLFGDNSPAGFRFEGFSGLAGDFAAFMGGTLCLDESPGVLCAGDFSSGGLAKHRKNLLKVAKMVAEVFTFQSLELLVLAGRETKGCL